MQTVQRINLNEKEAEERWGMSVHWFRRKRWAGGGPEYLKVGNRCLYPINSGDAFFNSKRRKSTSDTGRD